LQRFSVERSLLDAPASRGVEKTDGRKSRMRNKAMMLPNLEHRHENPTKSALTLRWTGRWSVPWTAFHAGALERFGFKIVGRHSGRSGLSFHAGAHARQRKEGDHLTGARVGTQ